MIVEERSVEEIFRSGLIGDLPRWARWAALATALLALPSGIWRIGVALGLTLGHTDDGRRELVGDGAAGPASMIMISLLTECAALLALGLVQRWGRSVPGWVPLAGGRPVPRRGVLAAAWTGVAVTAAAGTPFAAWWALPHDGMTATGALVVGFAHLPLVFWAPLLAALTLDFQRRTRPDARKGERPPG
ncbi:hypothetical protein [Actinocorallia longicatena]|uniref:Uncharacterized protein n=1 Tax=Actinocorallia longicatena TaxID=111803 RepID=A0ABP6QFD0_9ACTN